MNRLILTLGLLSCALPAFGVGATTGTPNSVANLSNGTADAIPYQSAPSVTTFLPIGSNTNVLVVSGGAPAWAASAPIATNIINGNVGSLPFQSAASVTTMLSAATNGWDLVLSGGLPAWAASVSSATNLVGGAGGSIPYQTAANTTAMLANGSSGNVLTSNGGTSAPSWQSVSGTLTGGIATVVPAWTSSTALGNGTTLVVNVSTGLVTSGTNAVTGGTAASLSGQFIAKSSAAFVIEGATVAYKSPNGDTAFGMDSISSAPVMSTNGGAWSFMVAFSTVQSNANGAISRAYNTVYQNVSYHPIFVSNAQSTASTGQVTCYQGPSASLVSTPNAVCFNAIASSADQDCFFFVMPGNSYECTTSGSISGVEWTEFK